ncbi:uncharacterized protein LOC132048905 [Lycium ferocissimum]|uniref:uncharacterized protein LOC132048905 n=1 Tax=Lycium ferocissimum TaxID=112874 RepID=UPI00281620C5|nr:uncharacterized protein LOC132048905 [Lycium ferocissimum]
METNNTFVVLDKEEEQQDEEVATDDVVELKVAKKEKTPEKTNGEGKESKIGTQSNSKADKEIEEGVTNSNRNEEVEDITSGAVFQKEKIQHKGDEWEKTGQELEEWNESKTPRSNRQSISIQEEEKVQNNCSPRSINKGYSGTYEEQDQPNADTVIK